MSSRAERYAAFLENCSEAFFCVELREPVPTDLDVGRQVELIYQHAYLIEANDVMARMYGLRSASEIVGESLETLLPRAKGKEGYLEGFVRCGYRQNDVETREFTRNGKTKYFLKNRIGIIEQGCLVRIWGTQRDITQRKRLEDHLGHAQKMEVIGRLAGGIAHDLNNILSVILTYATLLEGDDIDPQLRDGLQLIRSAAARGESITRPLLGFSRKQAVAVRRLDLNDVLRGLEKVLLRVVGDDVEIVMRLAQDLRPIQADAGAIEQVLLNLVVNARDAMPDGGRLTIETANADADADGPVGRPRGRHVMLSVGDTGVGMDEATQAQIFEPFFTTKELGKGSGFGLSIVYGLVKQSRGSIAVTSEPGHGTVFQIYLPEGAMPRAPTQPLQIILQPPRLGAGSVLLVADEPGVRASARAILEQEGHKVLEADDGESALALGVSHGGTIHLLLTDVTMPGWSGPELARRLIPSRPGMRVLYMSGYTDETLAVQVEGQPPHLRKPFTPDSLVRAVRAVLDPDGAR